jgi:putative PEP-CTERM system histidine kinase
VLAPLFYFTAVFAFVLAGIVVLRDRSARGRRVFALGLLLVSLQLVFSGLVYSSTSVLDARFWRAWWFVPQALAPPVWLFFTLRYARGNFEVSLRRWLPLLVAVTSLPLAAITLFQDSLFVAGESTTGGAAFELGFSGFVLYLCVVLSSALILINLERTFRAAVGTMRWRVKFVILGTATIYTAKLYTASQVLLFKTHSLAFDSVSAVAVLIACLLFLRGFFRAGIFQVQVYPSEQVLQFSIAGVLIGTYLVLIGLSTKFFSAWSGPEAFALKAFLLFASLASLGILLLSEVARIRLKRWISRHFHRPFYDYRATWLSFTEKTATIHDPDALCRVLVQWISEQFKVLSASVWLVEAESKEIRATASTALNLSPPVLSSTQAGEIIAALQKESSPFELGKRAEPWAVTLSTFSPDQFHHGGNQVCVPFIAGGRLVGLGIVGDRVNAIPLAIQDFELLKCVADQVAASFLNLQLSSRLLQAKELEAFQTIAAFFVHDLKNTASTLNLTLQNLPKHFDNPEFRKDALKAIGKSVNHIQDLISRLTLFRDKLEIKRSTVDLNSVVRSCLEALKGVALPLTVNLADVKPVSADADQLQKVLINLLLNARDALKENGRIELSTAQQNGCAILSVADNGTGMSAEFLSRSLFRPFKTTKKGGIGIGMFQSKAIVEAHGGSIEVESELGRGTTFRISLPIVQP